MHHAIRRGAACLVVCTTAEAGVLSVPGQFSTIQGAIDAALPGDEVVVSPGEHLGGCDFKGKPITVRSLNPEDPAVVVATIINGSGQPHTVSMVDLPAPGGTLAGFVIGGSNAFHEGDGLGGGVLVSNSEAKVSLCSFYSIAAQRGGGAAVLNSSAHFSRCTFVGCFALDAGGAAFVQASGVEFSDCEFIGNLSTQSGGAVLLAPESDVTLTRCSIKINSAGGLPGGAIMIEAGSTATIAGSEICANNTAPIHGEPYLDAGGNSVGYYCEPPPPPPKECDADLNGDGEVDGGDLGVLLSKWGLCERG